jgi:hypothetical protein
MAEGSSTLPTRNVEGSVSGNMRENVSGRSVHSRTPWLEQDSTSRSNDSEATGTQPVA